MTPRTKTLYAFGDTPAAKLQTINLQLNRTPGSDAGAMHVLHQMRSSGNSPAPQPAAAGQSPSEEEVSEPGGRKRSLNLSQDPISNGGGCASRLRAPRAPRLGTEHPALALSTPPWHAPEPGCLASPGACLLTRGRSAPLAIPPLPPLAIPPLPPVPEPAASSAADSAVASCPCRRSMRRRLESLGGAAPERSDSQASGEASDMGDNSS